MPLEDYDKKRKFEKTPEPKAEPEAHGNFNFVVQEHKASHLHWDFRLELPEFAPQDEKEPKEGTGAWVLKSWAVPKGPPEHEGVKRLAVQTEDHPVSYIGFKGEIPVGEYGAGSVKIWDSGHFILLKRNDAEIEFILNGKKLIGEYVLVKTKGFGGSKNSWLLFKK